MDKLDTSIKSYRNQATVTGEIRDSIGIDIWYFDASEGVMEAALSRSSYLREHTWKGPAIWLLSVKDTKRFSAALRRIAGDGSSNHGEEMEERERAKERDEKREDTLDGSSEGSVWCTEVDCTDVTLNRIT